MAPSLRSRKAAGAALLGISAAALTVGIVSTATGSSGGGSTGSQALRSSSSAAQPTESSTGAGSTSGSSGGSSSAEATGPAGSAGSSASAGAPSTSYPPGQTTTEVPAPGTNTSAQPPAATAAQQPGSSGGGGQPSAGQQLAPLRVYNNSTIKGLAARAAQDFRNAGYDVVSVGNYPQGVIPATTAYYRPGTDEQATAEKLGKRFGFGVQPRFSGIKNASPGVIVIVTNNYHG